MRNSRKRKASHSWREVEIMNLQKSRIAELLNFKNQTIMTVSFSYLISDTSELGSDTNKSLKNISNSLSLQGCSSKSSPFQSISGMD